MYLLEKIDVGIESFLALPLWNSNVSCLPSSSLRSLSQKSSHLRDFNAGTKSWTLVILALEAFRINSIPSGLDVHACPASTESTLHYVGSFLSLFLWTKCFGIFSDFFVNRETDTLGRPRLPCLVTKSTPCNTEGHILSLFCEQKNYFGKISEFCLWNRHAWTCKPACQAT